MVSFNLNNYLGVKSESPHRNTYIGLKNIGKTINSEIFIKDSLQCLVHFDINFGYTLYTYTYYSFDEVALVRYFSKNQLFQTPKIDLRNSAVIGLYAYYLSYTYIVKLTLNC